VEHLKGASLGPAKALLANIRHDLIDISGTNILGYYEYSKITCVKSFITLNLDWAKFCHLGNFSKIWALF
jgi:hypothetical protein